MFANPIFLYGLLAAAVPVIVHLIFRRKRTAVDYPTLMFFRRVDMKLASRRKLKEILLLVLRTLAITLVALALARPGLRGSGVAAGSADIVLIIDNSASMSLATPTGTRLELARARATGILDTLGMDGRAAILTTVPGDAAGEITSLSGDRERLNQTLRALFPTAGAGSLTGAITRAKEIFAQSGSGFNREIYIMSDFQANAFKDQQALREAAAGMASGVEAFLCPVPATAPEHNLSIVALSTDPRPKVAGRLMRLVATLKNNSQHEIAGTVTVAMRDTKPLSAAVSLEPGATQEVPLQVPLGQEGFTFGEVKLENDEAPYDNVWPFCLDVRGPIRALVLSPPQPRKAEDGEAFYLLKALDPTGDSRLSGIRVEHAVTPVPPLRLRGGGQGEGYDVVILCGSPSLAPAAIKALDEFVSGGGGMMVFSGPRDAALAANHPLQSLLNEGGKIAGEIRPEAAPAGNARHAEPFRLQAARPAAPYFDDCRGLDGNVEFKEVAVLHALRIEPAPGAEVLAQFSEGHPAVLVHKHGQGRVMWWAISPQADDSNFPLMPQFLAFLHRSVSVLANAQSQNICRAAGAPLIFDLVPPQSRAREQAAAPPSTVTIYDPTEKSFETPAPGGRVTWHQTGRAGVYRVELKAGGPSPAPGTGSQQPKAAARGAQYAAPPGFALTPDPEESAPEYFSTEAAVRALGFASAHAVDPGADLAGMIAISRQGRELFGYFILAALLMILAEVLLANMLGAKMKRPDQQKSAARSVAAALAAVLPRRVKAAPDPIPSVPVQHSDTEVTEAAEK